MKQGSKNFCGGRLEKIKNFGKMSVVEKHVLRKKGFEFGDNINLELSYLNNVYMFNGYEQDLITTYKKFLKKCKKEPRKDHIKCFQYVFYRSDCFDTQEEYDNYKKQTILFLQDYFKDCPFCVVEHNDESV